MIVRQAVDLKFFFRRLSRTGPLTRIIFLKRHILSKIDFGNCWAWTFPERRQGGVGGCGREAIVIKLKSRNRIYMIRAAGLFTAARRPVQQKLNARVFF